MSNITDISNLDSEDTDCSWAYDNEYILSSSDYGISVPNIYAFPSDGSGSPVRITRSTVYMDGAPAYSPDGNWIGLESHTEEDSPLEIWIIAAPVLP